MSSEKPVLVVVTAATCGACQNLYKQWGPIRKAIQDLGTVELKEIKLPKMNSPVTSFGYPEDLQRYILWFPTAILFDGNNWKDVNSGKSKKLHGEIMNGDVDSEYPTGNTYRLTKEGFTQFVKDKLPLLTASKSPSIPSTSSTLMSSKRNIVPTYGSSEVCRKLNLKPKYYHRK